MKFSHCIAILLLVLTVMILTFNHCNNKRFVAAETAISRLQSQMKAAEAQRATDNADFRKLVNDNKPAPFRFINPKK